MKSSKTRRESGRSYNKFYDPENGLYNTQHWDDWNDYRDGQRNRYGRDKSRLLRTNESNRLKVPTMHMTKNYRTGETVEYMDDGFEKIHINNMKLKTLIHRRKEKQQKNK